jgi:phosphonate metabolism protein PhnM
VREHVRIASARDQRVLLGVERGVGKPALQVVGPARHAPAVEFARACVGELAQWVVRVYLHGRRQREKAAHEHGIALATHDDTTVEHVNEARALGAAMSEFPTTLEAARHATLHGLATVAGAPNVVRGGSHSGNVSALELAREGVLDALSSDYVPGSLLQAAWLLQRDAGFTLSAAVAVVSRHPARACGLNDRGEIAEGLRADLVRVREIGGQPAVREVFARGVRVS